MAAAYHAIFLALLVAATFIDYDLMMIPDQITITGMVVGIGAGDALASGSTRAGILARHHPSPRFLGRRARASWSARA